MWHKASARAPRWAVVVVLILLLATTALAAAQSPDVLLPLITGGGTQRVPAEQAEPETPVDDGIPPVVEEELDPNAPVGDSQDTHSGDFDQAPAEMAAVDAFNATQWTVQNNLGIGTQTPTEPLDIERNVNNYTRLLVRNPHAGNIAQAQLYLNTVGSNGVVLQQFGSGFSATWNGLSLKNIARLRTTPGVTGLILTTGGNYPLILGTADAERMRITPDGRVGIGTTTPVPSARLNVHGASGVNGVYVSQAVNGVYVSQPSQNGMYVYQPGGPGLYVACPCGGGGPFADAGVLVENGNIIVSNGNFIDIGTALNVPDYVFEPEYPLLSLDELRAYVAEEKHLPNVPNEEEIRAGGLDLSDFQMKLLEKTEELTLYTLAQDEQLHSQQQEIESLRQENRSMQQENRAMQEMIADLEERLAALEAQK